MLSLEPKDLLNEIRDAEKRLKPFLEKRRELVQAFAGSMYHSEHATQKTPDNYAFAWSQYIGPQILFGAPACNVDAENVLQDQSLADGLNSIMAYWIEETAVELTLRRVKQDISVGFAWTKVGVAPRGHYRSGGQPAVEGNFEQRPNFPYLVRIDPACMIVDAHARDFNEARILGHKFERDLDDVQSDERYDPEAVAKLSEKDETESKPEDVFGHVEHSATRKRIALYELWIREHGVIVTLADKGEEPITLRREPYFGPDEGPYTLWGLSYVPGELMPISPLAALWETFEEIQEHTRQAAGDAKAHKKIGVYNPSHADDAKRLQDAKSGDLVGIKDPGSLNNFEIGGASEFQLKYVDRRRVIYEQMLGMGESQQGSASDSTATAESIAQGNAQLRVDEMKQHVRLSLTDAYRKVLWYFINDASIGRISLSIEQNGQPVAGTFVAGPWSGGFIDNQWYDSVDVKDADFRLNVDARSLTKTNDQMEKARAQDELQLAFQLAGMGMPVNWRRMLDRYGDCIGSKDYSKTVLLDVDGMMGLPLDPLNPMKGMPGQVASMLPPGMMGMPPSPPQGIPGRAPQSNVPPARLASQAQQRANPMRSAMAGAV